MAYYEEASPICRGKNLSWETVLLFYNNMPRTALPKPTFHSYVESRINGWTQTHSQIARQLAFYYEQDGMCYPRFTEETTYSDLFLYMQNWASKYFVPNPYAPSLKAYDPVCLYLFLKNSIEQGNTDFDAALDSIFEVKLSSHDKVNVFLSNFTNIVIDGNHQMRINDRINFPEVKQDVLNDYVSDAKKYFDYFTIKNNNSLQRLSRVNSNLSLQQIFYGAPGTGKSHATNEVAEMYDTIRTTFHPDSDYSTFVGAYKPTMNVENRYYLNGTKTEVMKDTEGKDDLKESKIVYKFVKQAFLKAYIKAWQLFKESCKDGQELTPMFFVIEEINRGNCAQIFGDFFQLLDRKNGFSEYPIEADEDIVKALLDEEPDDKLSFGKNGLQLSDEQKDYVDSFFDKQGKPKKNVAEKICKGEVLALPPNLYIWATMNTSDQSLFPIDSAFKRRWDWKYMRIKNHPEKGWKIKFDGVDVDWWKFLQAINSKIEYATKSEDKKLGYFFCKPTKFETASKPISVIDGNGNEKDVAGTIGTQAPNNLFVVEEETISDTPTIITAETFVGKVIFYLWNDVFKVSGRKNNIFAIDGKAISFHDFYLEDDANDEANPDNLNLENVAKFIENVMKEDNDSQTANE